MSHTPLGNSHVVIDGQFVSQKHSRIVEAIHAYEPALRVDYIPPGKREEGDSAFRIVYVTPLGLEQTLFYVPNEDDFDERVLLRIIHNDQRNGQVQKSELEAFNEAQRLLAQQQYMDAMEEANDIAWHAFKTKLNTYKVSDDLIIKEGIPFNVAHKDL